MIKLPPLLGKNLDELSACAVDAGMPRFVGSQLAKWLYEYKVTSFDEMTNISVRNRKKLAEFYSIGRSEPVASTRSSDGTVKYLFTVGEGQRVESVR